MGALYTAAVSGGQFLLLAGSMATGKDKKVSVFGGFLQDCNCELALRVLSPESCGSGMVSRWTAR